MRKLTALTLALLALALVGVGCGGDDDDDDGGGAENTEQPAEGGGGGDGSTSGGAGGAQVSMKDIQFDPSDVTVSAGDTITFTNDEGVAHDVHKTSGPGKNFASGPPGGMQQGNTFKLTLNKAGKYEYVCEVHAPGMAGTITVK